MARNDDSGNRGPGIHSRRTPLTRGETTSSQAIASGTSADVTGITTAARATQQTSVLSPFVPSVRIDGVDTTVQAPEYNAHRTNFKMDRQNAGTELSPALAVHTTPTAADSVQRRLFTTAEELLLTPTGSAAAPALPSAFPDVTDTEAANFYRNLDAPAPSGAVPTIQQAPAQRGVTFAGDVAPAAGVGSSTPTRSGGRGAGLFAPQPHESPVTHLSPHAFRDGARGNTGAPVHPSAHTNDPAFPRAENDTGTPTIHRRGRGAAAPSVPEYNPITHMPQGVTATQLPGQVASPLAIPASRTVTFAGDAPPAGIGSTPTRSGGRAQGVYSPIASATQTARTAHRPSYYDPSAYNTATPAGTMPASTVITSSGARAVPLPGTPLVGEGDSLPAQHRIPRILPGTEDFADINAALPARPQVSPLTTGLTVFTGAELRRHQRATAPGVIPATREAAAAWVPPQTIQAHLAEQQAAEDAIRNEMNRARAAGPVWRNDTVVEAPGGSGTPREADAPRPDGVEIGFMEAASGSSATTPSGASHGGSPSSGTTGTSGTSLSSPHRSPHAYQFVAQFRDTLRGMPPRRWQDIRISLIEDGGPGSTPVRPQSVRSVELSPDAKFQAISDRAVRLERAFGRGVFGEEGRVLALENVRFNRLTSFVIERPDNFNDMDLQRALFEAGINVIRNQRIGRAVVPEVNDGGTGAMPAQNRGDAEEHPAAGAGRAGLVRWADMEPAAGPGGSDLPGGRMRPGFGAAAGAGRGGHGGGRGGHGGR